MNEPLTPTEQIIVNTTIEREQLRFALLGCLAAARGCLRDIDERKYDSDAKAQAKVALRYIENEAKKALYGVQDGKESGKNGEQDE